MPDHEILGAFAGIVTEGHKNNTYKFALARFLLDHAARGGPEQVRYKQIAEHFMRYYWVQECKFRLRQGPANQQPEIITIIREEFPEHAYPQTFAEIGRERPESVKRCVARITRVCFDDVVPRFQKVGGRERRIFYKYIASECRGGSDNKKIDPGGGILVNREAMRVLRDNRAALDSMVTREWTKFLEKRNPGMPNMADKVEATTLVFEDVPDHEILGAFAGIVTEGHKNNTYKFALARFLLDHAARGGPEQVRYKQIAEHFMRYYWVQECKFRLRQGPANQQPEIITIIREEFPEHAYPQTFAEIGRERPESVKRCVARITRVCFDDVVPRFQKVGGRERRIFYKYIASECRGGSDNKKIDPGGGILVNREAMRVLRDNRAALHSTVTLEWAKFLEKRNPGMPNMVKKAECAMADSHDQQKFLGVLEPFFGSCFYCRGELARNKCMRVDHVIPYDYIGDTELCNLVLACQKCSCKKKGQLPPRPLFDKLLERNSNSRYLAEIPRLGESVENMSVGRIGMEWHYANAKLRGYPVWQGR